MLIKLLHACCEYLLKVILSLLVLIIKHCAVHFWQLNVALFLVAMDNEGVKIPLRLHVHKETHQVIFAEANSDFVDTLFSFLTLPMGTVVRILKNQCVSVIYSLGKLDASEVCTKVSKNLMWVTCGQRDAEQCSLIQEMQQKRGVNN